MNSSIDSAVLRLRELGIDVVSSGDALFNCSLDHTRYSVLPKAVVFASCIEDVQNIVKIANEFDVGLTVRGSGTGCAGGAVPIDCGIVLDVSRINSIEIDASSRMAKVGAGAITADIDAKANEFGLFYAPDPSSHKFCSIGGNIACNAGGLRALKYGTTRDNVVSLKVVSGSGEIINCALPLKKYSVGFNLRDLFIGSEGQLGIVVEAFLRLLPIPETKKTLVAFFNDDFEAFAGVGKLMRSSLEPCVLEFMDSDTVACVREKKPHLQLPSGKSILLIEFDGTVADVDESVEKCSVLFENVRVAESEDERQGLWEIRRSASSAMYKLADTKINQDIVLPLSELSSFFEYYKALGQKFGLPSPVFGHSGDGNYHIHFMYNASDCIGKRNAEKAMDLSIKKAIELGGAVSGEHGIGFLKSKYMSLQHSSIELEYMRKIKEQFDPKKILNRGKVLECFDIPENLAPLKNVKLAWDK